MDLGTWKLRIGQHSVSKGANEAIFPPRRTWLFIQPSLAASYKEYAALFDAKRANLKVSSAVQDLTFASGNSWAITMRMSNSPHSRAPVIEDLASPTFPHNPQQPVDAKAVVSEEYLEAFR